MDILERTFLKAVGKSLMEATKRHITKKCRPPLPNTKCMKLPRPCGKVREDKVEQQPKPTRTVPQNPECCGNPCPDAYPRFDDIYYAPSDKAKRKYQQTWVDCPKIEIKQVEVCCRDEPHVEEMEKRHFPKTPKCPEPAHCLLMRLCRSGGASKCSKIRWPGCGPCRSPPKCQRPRKYCGQRQCPPQPSFSECQRDRPKELKPIECKCLFVGPICKRH